MNHMLDGVRWPLPNVCFSQSDGIRMHHLLGWNLTKIYFLTSPEGLFMEFKNYGLVLPIGCPITSLRQFIDMYVDPGELQKVSEHFTAQSDLIHWAGSTRIH